MHAPNVLRRRYVIQVIGVIVGFVGINVIHLRLVFGIVVPPEDTGN
jgi:hypothetical protein